MKFDREWVERVAGRGVEAEKGLVGDVVFTHTISDPDVLAMGITQKGIDIMKRVKEAEARGDHEAVEAIWAEVGL
jgi:hypothetical protein